MRWKGTKSWEDSLRKACGNHRFHDLYMMMHEVDEFFIGEKEVGIYHDPNALFAYPGIILDRISTHNLRPLLIEVLKRYSIGWKASYISKDRIRVGFFAEGDKNK